MRHTLYLLILTLVLVSCGTDSHHFKIDGRLLHLNQGEFYVYSPDGGSRKMDTIRVEAGRFSYETQCDREMTLMIVFPNFTEQPVFAQPGKTADVKGDASHLKELQVKGTKANELMTGFRQQVATASPPEAVRLARQFITDHPESIVSTYLLRKYFLQTANPDAATARQLTELMIARQPDNGSLKRIRHSLKDFGTTAVGAALPAVSAYAIDGKPVSKATLSQTAVTIICTWATWNYQSISMLRRCADAAAQTGGKVQVVGLCVDASRAECRRTMQQQNISCTVVCDEQMFASPVMRRLGLADVPDNMVVRGGRVAAAHLDDTRLTEMASGR